MYELEDVIVEVLKEFSGALLDDETCRSMLIRLKHFGVPAVSVQPYADEEDGVGICITCEDETQYLLADIIEFFEEDDDEQHQGDVFPDL